MVKGLAQGCGVFALAALVVVSAAPADAGHGSVGAPDHAGRTRLANDCANHTMNRRARHSTSRGGRCSSSTKRSARPSPLALYSSYADTAPPSTSDTSLPPGGFRYWQGPTVSSGDVPVASACGFTGPCYQWPLRVGKRGWRLRVALDTPMRSNTFELDVVDPKTGHVTSVTNTNMFDAEAYILNPPAGVWAVRVMPQDVSYASVRMRAKLEAAPSAMPKGHVALLPELRADPPMEFTFTAPANPANGLYPPDTVNPPLDVLGVHPLSCSADEMAPTEVGGGGAHARCLRFTSGPINAGVGPYEMHWTYAQDIANGQIHGGPLGHGPMYQTIHYADGTTSTRRAGTYEFHVTHGHFHDDGILDMRLFRVNPDDSLTPAGVGTKSGFCPANQLIGVWRSFDNGPPDAGIGSGDIGAGNCQHPVNGVLGLSPGWGDVYRWQRPGMYVEFGNNPDGLYVVRITIDSAHDVLQSRYAYNSSYALVKVTGDNVQEIERGQGLGPWDPHKIVFTGAGPASQN
jgi:hypothetical protein